jgi:hypothetical protein
VRLVSEKCVPVALNLYHVRADNGPAGAFFKTVQKQRPAQYQGLYLVSPEGKVLASHQAFKSHKTWPQEVLADLTSGLKDFGDVLPRPVQKVNALPYRGVGVRPDGSVTLAVQERLVLVKDLEKEPPSGALGAIVPDSITLTAADWAAFAPPQTEIGTKWTVPQAVARKFYPLLSVSDTVFRDPQEVTSVEIIGEVRKVADGVASLGFSGHLAGKHLGTKNEGKLGNQVSAEAQLLGGVGQYDTKTGQLGALTLVFDGQWRGWAPYDKTTSRFGAVVEWRKQ